MIGRQATSSLARKLASRPFILKMSKRFVDVGSVDNFIAEQENKATLQKTQRDVKLLQTVLGTRNELRKVEEIPAQELNEYISVRTKNGTMSKFFAPKSVGKFLSYRCSLSLLFERNLSTCEINTLQHGTEMLCTIFNHWLFRIRKLTRWLRSLVRFLILLNS